MYIACYLYAILHMGGEQDSFCPPLREHFFYQLFLPFFRHSHVSCCRHVCSLALPFGHLSSSWFDWLDHEGPSRTDPGCRSRQISATQACWPQAVCRIPDFNSKASVCKSNRYPAAAVEAFESLIEDLRRRGLKIPLHYE